MASYVTHPRVANGRFDYAQPPVYEKVKDDETAVGYFSKDMSEPLAEARHNELEQARAVFGDVTIFDLLDGLQPPKGRLGLLSRPGLSLPAMWPWHIEFFENVNYNNDEGGDSFTMGVITNTSVIVALNPLLASCDWDSDLTKRNGPRKEWPHKGTWNDAITSLNCQGVSKFWVLCEHIGYGGEKLFGEGNAPDLGSFGWNDRASSIVMSSVSSDVIKEAIKILIG